MVNNNTDKFNTPFTISVDAKEGISTGVSVSDRITTLKLLIDPETKPEDLTRPGHVFPLRPAKNGILDRRGHTEAAIDLMKLAGLFPAAVIAEIMIDDGEMAKLDDLKTFSKERNIKIVTIADLMKYRLKTE